MLLMAVVLNELGNQLHLKSFSLVYVYICGNEYLSLCMSFTSGAEGGNYLIKLLESQLPQHTHTGMGGPLMIAGAGDRAQIASGTNATYGTTNGGENCNNDAINIQNPYIVVKMWKRVS